MSRSTLIEMNNVGIVVASLDAVIPFFEEIGLVVEGKAHIDGAWAGRVTGIEGQRVEVTMMVTPDGHSRIELSQFISPPVASDHRQAPVNSLGYLRAMFRVSNLHELLERLTHIGVELVGAVENYEGVYLLCYVRGPEGILVGLAEQLTK